ncbi:MAG: hypothetical protein AB7U29_03530 [Desulfobulbus sp.]
MIRSIFVLPRRGLVGGRPVGSDYMVEILDRAKRMDRACRECGDLPFAGDERQMALPFPAKTTTLITKCTTTPGAGI